MVKPLLDLFKKGLFFEWKEEQQKAFEDLKEKLSSSHVLMFLDFNKPFEIIHINANDITIRRVFMQERHSTTLRARKLIEHNWVKTFLGVNTRNHLKE